MRPVHQFLQDATERVGSCRDPPVFPDMVSRLDGLQSRCRCRSRLYVPEFKPITRASLSACVLDVTEISTWSMSRSSVRVPIPL